jgi:hypothetical protein
MVTNEVISRVGGLVLLLNNSSISPRKWVKHPNSTVGGIMRPGKTPVSVEKEQ